MVLPSANVIRLPTTSPRFSSFEAAGSESALAAFFFASWRVRVCANAPAPQTNNATINVKNLAGGLIIKLN